MAEAGVFRGLGTVLLRGGDVHEAAAWYRAKLGLEPSFQFRDLDGNRREPCHVG